MSATSIRPIDGIADIKKVAFLRMRDDTPVFISDSRCNDDAATRVGRE